MKQETPNYIVPKKMTKKELQKWIKWATGEITEYSEFLKVLNKELKRI